MGSIGFFIDYIPPAVNRIGRGVEGVRFAFPLAGITGSDPAGDMYVCLLQVFFCCQVEVSESGLSLVQRSPTEYGTPEYVHEASTVWRPRSTMGCLAQKKNIFPAALWPWGRLGL